MRNATTATFLAGTALAGTGVATADAQDINGGPAPALYNWTGFYLGLHAGGIWTDNDGGGNGDCGPFRDFVGDDDGGPPPTWDTVSDGLNGCYTGIPVDGPNAGSAFPTFDLDDDYVSYTGGRRSFDRSSWLGGAHIGVMRQYNRIVLGVEGEFSAVGDLGGSQTTHFDYYHEQLGPLFGIALVGAYEGSGTVTSKSELDWLATIRGRVGATFGNEGQVLGYVTAGVAIAGVDNSISGTFSGPGTVDWCQAGCFFDSSSGGDDTEVGIALGVGAEVAINNYWRAGVEYMFVGFDGGDKQSITFHADDTRQFDVVHKNGIDDVHLVRLRLSRTLGMPAN